MLLTLYYMAATWIQSWRLNSMRLKILQLLSQNGSLVVYREPVPMEMEGLGLYLSKVTSTSCINKCEAKVGDLLWYVGNKRGCSVFPQQRVNVVQWISFDTDKCAFPIELNGSQVVLSEENRLHLLLEADYQSATSVRDENYCQLEQYGVFRAWKAADYFGIILETDVDHLTKLAANFLTTKLSIDDGMELIRIQTVVVEGRPCLLLNADTIPVSRSSTKKDDESLSDKEGSQQNIAREDLDYLPRKVGQMMSPLQWRSHLELLQSFSEAAEQAATGSGQMEVAGYSSALVAPGGRPFTLDTPTIVDIPDVDTNNMRSVSQETFSPHHLSRGGSDETESRLEEEKSVESFHSVAQDPVPQDTSSSTPSDIPSSIKHTELSPRESKSSDSFCSLGSASTLSVVSQSGGKPGEVGREELSSLLHDLVIFKHPIRTRGLKMKPPNVLVFSESAATLDDTVAVLHSTLQRHRYCIYPTSKPLLLSSPWSDHTQLLVVCGTVPDVLAPVFMSYLLSGGHMLCLCSDFLHLVLPTFRTAEVRERELVQFSYGRWKQVPMMHHIFCYQASPAKSRFPQEDDGHRLTNPPQPPATVEVMDGENRKHTLQVQVLGAEETWHTPSLLLASVGSSGGKVVFSQVHLEVDPGQYESEETKFKALQKSDKARLEILQDLLSSHLGLSVAEKQGPLPAYTPGYFLGRHELKLDFLSALQPRLKADNILKLNLLSLQFCGKGVEPAKPTASLMPVFLHACPQRFSTVEYFENLHSEHIGRLLIFSEVMTSSMEGLDGAVLQHGLAVVACQQISGAGRSGNAWLSPEGCGMFSLQLHIRSDSYLGHHVPFLQHVVSLAVVLAICSQAGHEDVDLHLKWPNDIYVGDCIKVGGLVVKTIVDNTMTVCNIGVGMNLDNTVPTTCINALLRELKLAPLSLEKFLALVFTKLEKLLVTLEKGSSGVDQVRQLYYKYWLHSNCEVTVIGPQGSKQEVTILGIDDFGFLQVLAKDGCAFSVHPDGNSFDMLRGLIAPKVK